MSDEGKLCLVLSMVAVLVIWNLLTKKRKPSATSGQIEDDSADLEDDSDNLDDMLEDDFDDDYPEKDRVKKIDSSLKIEDDD